MLSVSLFVYFSSDKLANHTHKNVFLACLLQPQHKKGVVQF